VGFSCLFFDKEEKNNQAREKNIRNNKRKPAKNLNGKLSKALKQDFKR
jgi:hypothetical protein